MKEPCTLEIFNESIERDGQYILGLVNSQNYCFVNSVLQVNTRNGQSPM